MRLKLVAGNWKMNGSLAANQALLETLLSQVEPLAGAECAVCVPYPYLGQVRELLQRTSVRWGAQDVSQFAAGAYTGEVSGAMLADFGCRYVIVGHSERRTLFAETSGIVAEKYEAAQKAGLTPILCVGETLEEREQGKTEAVVARQLDTVLERCGASSLGKAAIAYEPVWAIGTGRTATPEQAQAVHRFVRERIAARDRETAAGVRLLYGGSVKGANAGELFAMSDIDGGLIGGASLDASEFATIVRAARRAD
jgi:triosephosphate isomerase (TIM)